MMKTLALFISLMTLWTLNNYGQSEDVTELLENQETRTEVFNSILNSHALMTEFIHAMHHNDHAMMMIRGDSAMMGNSSMGGMHCSSEHQMMGMQKMKEQETGDQNANMKMMNSPGETKDTKNHHMHNSK